MTWLSHNHITEFHLNVNGVQLQKVKIAAQLLSRTIAKIMQFYEDMGALTSNWKEVHLIWYENEYDWHIDYC